MLLYLKAFISFNAIATFCLSQSSIFIQIKFQIFEVLKFLVVKLIPYYLCPLVLCSQIEGRNENLVFTHHSFFCETGEITFPATNSDWKLMTFLVRQWQWNEQFEKKTKKFNFVWNSYLNNSTYSSLFLLLRSSV